jgi:hypothetical protein
VTPPRKMSLVGVRYAHASSHTSKGKQTTSLNLRTRINAIDHLSGELFLAWQLTGVGPPAARGNRKVGDCPPSTSKLSAVNVNFTAAKKRSVLVHEAAAELPSCLFAQIECSLVSSLLKWIFEMRRKLRSVSTDLRKGAIDERNSQGWSDRSFVLC